MGRTEEKPKGLELLEEHEVAPEISQLLDYGQHRDDEELEPSQKDIRFARLSVVQTVALSLVIAIIAILGVVFALHRQPATPGVQPDSHTRPSAVTQPDTSSVPDTVTPGNTSTASSILPIDSSSSNRYRDGFQPRAGAVDQILDGPVKNLIAWHYTTPDHKLCGPLGRAFGASLMVRSVKTTTPPDQRMLVLDSRGKVQWEVEYDPKENISSWAGNDLYAVVAVDKQLQAFDPWGKLTWQKDLPAPCEGNILTDKNSRWYYRSGEELTCLGPHGHEFWQYDAGSQLIDDPLIGKHIMCATKDGALHCLDYTGKLIWRKDLQVGAAPVWGKGGTMFVGCSQQYKFYKLDMDGNVLWEGKSGCKSDLFQGFFLPLDDGGVILLNTHPDCVRFDADGQGRRLFNHIGRFQPPYKVDDKRFAIVDDWNGIEVFNIDGTYEYTLPLSIEGSGGFVAVPGGSFFGIVAGHEIAAIKQLP